MGIQSLYQNTIGSYNASVGSLALSFNTTGTYNTAQGYKALFSNTTANHNTAFGSEAIRQNTTGQFNTAVGDSALFVNTTQSFNTALGHKADVSNAGITNSTAIGNRAKIGMSNGMAFGDTTTLTWSFARSVNDAGNAMQVGTTASNGNGAYLTAGGVWTNTSDVNRKSNFTDLDGGEILNRITQLHIQQWDYTGSPVRETHIGPMAQEFKELFGLGVGANDTSISTVDPAGVALVGIQELARENQELKKEILELRNMVETILAEKK